jgi:hypothetical protein
MAASKPKVAQFLIKVKTSEVMEVQRRVFAVP